MRRRTWKRLAWVFAIMTGGLVVLIVFSMFYCIGFGDTQTIYPGTFDFWFEWVPIGPFWIERIGPRLTWSERFTYATRAPHVVWRGIKPYTLDLPLIWPTALLAALALVCEWRGRRVEPGHCQRCGYNLTGNVSGVCPECGTAVKRDA